MAQIATPLDQLRVDDLDGSSKSSRTSNFKIKSHFQNNVSANDMAALLADHRLAIALAARPPETSDGAEPARGLLARASGTSRPRRKRTPDAGDGVSQDLHDCGGYHLALLQISLKLLEAFVPEGRGRAHLNRTKVQLARFAADLGSIASARADAPCPRPDVDCRDLDAFLTETLDAWSLASGLPVDFRCNRPHLQFPIALEQPLLRVLQESLTNVLKHARTASRVAVDLTVRRGTLTLTVGDDGCGFDPALAQPRRATGAGNGGSWASGVGLPGMTARMAGIGGRLTVESACGQGTRIRARLRLPRPD